MARRRDLGCARWGVSRGSCSLFLRYINSWYSKAFPIRSTRNICLHALTILPRSFSLPLGWLILCVLLRHYQTKTVASKAKQGGEGQGPSKEVWRNTVKVERCRYLEASKCKGTCMNLCKLPTETFFREDLGTYGWTSRHVT